MPEWEVSVVLTVTGVCRAMLGIVCISYIKPKELAFPCRAQDLSLFFITSCLDKYLLGPLPGCTALSLHFKPPRFLIYSQLYLKGSWSRNKVLKKSPLPSAPRHSLNSTRHPVRCLQGGVHCEVCRELKIVNGCSPSQERWWGTRHNLNFSYPPPSM